MKYTHHGKEVLCDGKCFADASCETSAALIVKALEQPSMISLDHALARLGICGDAALNVLAAAEVNAHALVAGAVEASRTAARPVAVMVITSLVISRALASSLRKVAPEIFEELKS